MVLWQRHLHVAVSAGAGAEHLWMVRAVAAAACKRLCHADPGMRVHQVVLAEGSVVRVRQVTEIYRLQHARKPRYKLST